MNMERKGNVLYYHSLNYGLSPGYVTQVTNGNGNQGNNLTSTGVPPTTNVPPGLLSNHGNGLMPGLVGGGYVQKYAWPHLTPGQINLLFKQRMDKKKVQTPVECEACSLKLNSDAQAQQHFSGKAHLKRLRKLGLPIPEEHLGKISTRSGKRRYPCICKDLERSQLELAQDKPSPDQEDSVKVPELKQEEGGSPAVNRDSEAPPPDTEGPPTKKRRLFYRRRWKPFKCEVCNCGNEEDGGQNKGEGESGAEGVKTTQEESQGIITGIGEQQGTDGKSEGKDTEISVNQVQRDDSEDDKKESAAEDSMGGHGNDDVATRSSEGQYSEGGNATGSPTQGIEGLIVKNSKGGLEVKGLTVELGDKAVGVNGLSLGKDKQGLIEYDKIEGAGEVKGLNDVEGELIEMTGLSGSNGVTVAVTSGASDTSGLDNKVVSSVSENSVSVSGSSSSSNQSPGESALSREGLYTGGSHKSTHNQGTAIKWSLNYRKRGFPEVNKRGFPEVNNRGFPEGIKTTSPNALLHHNSSQSVHMAAPPLSPLNSVRKITISAGAMARASQDHMTSISNGGMSSGSKGSEASLINNSRPVSSSQMHSKAFGYSSLRQTSNPFSVPSTTSTNTGAQIPSLHPVTPTGIVQNGTPTWYYANYASPASINYANPASMNYASPAPNQNYANPAPVNFASPSPNHYASPASANYANQAASLNYASPASPAEQANMYSSYVASALTANTSPLLLADQQSYAIVPSLDLNANQALAYGMSPAQLPSAFPTNVGGIKSPSLPSGHQAITSPTAYVLPQCYYDNNTNSNNNNRNCCDAVEDVDNDDSDDEAFAAEFLKEFHKEDKMADRREVNNRSGEETQNGIIQCFQNDTKVAEKAETITSLIGRCLSEDLTSSHGIEERAQLVQNTDNCSQMVNHCKSARGMTEWTDNSKGKPVSKCLKASETPLAITSHSQSQKNSGELSNQPKCLQSPKCLPPPPSHNSHPISMYNLTEFLQPDTDKQLVIVPFELEPTSLKVFHSQNFHPRSLYSLALSVISVSPGSSVVALGDNSFPSSVHLRSERYVSMAIDLWVSEDDSDDDDVSESEMVAAADESAPATTTGDDVEKVTTDEQTEKEEKEEVKGQEVEKQEVEEKEAEVEIEYVEEELELDPNDPVAAAILEEMQGKLAFRGKRDRPCHVCDLYFNSDAQLETHYRSEKHRKKYKEQGGDPSELPEKERNTDPDIYCEVCDLDFMSDEQYEQHMAGKKHRLKSQSVSSCGVCAMVFNSDQQAKQHFSSSKHRKKVAHNKGITDYDDDYDRHGKRRRRNSGEYYRRFVEEEERAIQEEEELGSTVELANQLMDRITQLHQNIAATDMARGQGMHGGDMQPPVFPMRGGRGGFGGDMGGPFRGGPPMRGGGFGRPPRGMGGFGGPPRGDMGGGPMMGMDDGGFGGPPPMGMDDMPDMDGFGPGGPRGRGGFRGRGGQRGRGFGGGGGGNAGGFGNNSRDEFENSSEGRGFRGGNSRNKDGGFGTGFRGARDSIDKGFGASRGGFGGNSKDEGNLSDNKGFGRRFSETKEGSGGGFGGSSRGKPFGGRGGGFSGPNQERGFTNSNMDHYSTNKWSSSGENTNSGGGFGGSKAESGFGGRFGASLKSEEFGRGTKMGGGFDNTSGGFNNAKGDGFDSTNTNPGFGSGGFGGLNAAKPGDYGSAQTNAFGGGYGNSNWNSATAGSTGAMGNLSTASVSTSTPGYDTQNTGGQYNYGTPNTAAVAAAVAAAAATQSGGYGGYDQAYYQQYYGNMNYEEAWAAYNQYYGYDQSYRGGYEMPPTQPAASTGI